MPAIEFDPADYLDEISTIELEEELRTRKDRSLANDGAMDLLQEAYEECMRGRPVHAAALLEQVLYPRSQNDINAKLAAWRRARDEAVA